MHKSLLCLIITACYIAGVASAPLTNGVSSVLTSAGGHRFAQQPEMSWGPAVGKGKNVLTMDASSKKQSIFGFGSALTEAAAFNFAHLPDDTRGKLIDMLWAPPPVGNGYTAGRLHLGSADFALSTYSLDDTAGDYNMSHFDDKLTHESKYILPLARAAQAAAKTVNGDGLKLFFSPWSPPAWLKINNNMIDSVHPEGLLQTPAAGAALASYFVKYTKALTAAGVPVWGCTMQNEPLMVMKPNHTHYEACSYTPESQAKWLRDHLGPAVRGDPETAHLKLLAYDWNKGELAHWAKTVREINANNTYLDGFGVHWYQWGGGLKLDDLATLQKDAPGTFVIGTEASLIKHGIAAEAPELQSSTSAVDNHGTLVGAGAPPGNGTVKYTYASGELMALDILGDIRFGASGWVDWNAILDYHGGPNHVDRTDIGAPILVDIASQSYYVQSPYYYMGHVSRYVPPGSVRVSCSGEGFAETSDDYDKVKDYLKPLVKGTGPAPAEDVDLVAECFASADGSTGSVVVMNPNKGDKGKEVTLSLVGTGAVKAHMPPHSMKTFTFAL